jgi:hypothetical protein
MHEILKRMQKLTHFHTTYFKMFPNFILLPEKHNMYKDLLRKQRVIDGKQYISLMNKHMHVFLQPSYSRLLNES